MPRYDLRTDLTRWPDARYERLHLEPELHVKRQAIDMGVFLAQDGIDRIRPTFASLAAGALCRVAFHGISQQRKVSEARLQAQKTV